MHQTSGKHAHFRENKPETSSDGKRVLKINSYNFCRIPVCESGVPWTQVKATPLALKVRDTRVVEAVDPEDAKEVG